MMPAERTRCELQRISFLGTGDASMFVKAPKSRVCVRIWRRGPVDLAGNVSLEAANDLLLGLALGGALCHVGSGTLVAAHAADGDHVQRPALASRFPCRFKRWRTLFLPEEARIGAAPHRCAKAASLLSRSGLSPAAISSE